MRVAISTDGIEVSMHFGRCPEFTIVDLENKEIKNRKTIPNPGHHPGYIPEFLKEREVNAIVAGGMGARAQALFTQFGIQTILGVSGSLEEVIDALKKETLNGKESLCQSGSGKGYGIDKTVCDHGEHQKHSCH